MFLVPAAFTVHAARSVEAAEAVAHYTATTVNINPGNRAASDTLKIDLLRWSTDTERDQLLDAFKDEKTFFEALKRQPSVGYIWTSASVGFSVRYAYRVPASGDAERIILITDRHLESGGPQAWTTAVKFSAPEYPYTLIELRMGQTGGEGKMSIAGTVGADAAARTLALENYAGAPQMLKTVKKATTP
jgi:hypothetical protein